MLRRYPKLLRAALKPDVPEEPRENVTCAARQPRGKLPVPYVAMLVFLGSWKTIGAGRAGAPELQRCGTEGGGWWAQWRGLGI